MKQLFEESQILIEKHSVISRFDGGEIILKSKNPNAIFDLNRGQQIVDLTRKALNIPRNLGMVTITIEE